MSDSNKTRKRMVVEEVGAPSEPVNPETVEEIKEKVEELQDLTENLSQTTENLSETVDKSANVQEDLAKAVEEVSVDSAPQADSKDSYVPEIKSGGPNPLTIIIPGIFLLGALLGGIVFYQNKISGGSATPTSTLTNNYLATTAPSATSSAATATPMAKLDLTKYPINVMNGSGISEQAGVVKNLLTTAGFSVSGIGNASSYDFTKTVIKAKADVPAAFLSQLSTTLSKEYVLDSNQTLPSTSSGEVEVIVGSMKAQ